MRKMAILALILAITGGTSVTGQDQDPRQEDEIRILVEKGVDLALRGKGKEAVVHLEQALSKVSAADNDVDKIRLSGLLYAIVDKVQIDTILKVVNDTSADQNLRNAMQRLLELSKPGVHFEPTDEQLKEYLTQFKSQDNHVYLSGLFHLVQFGPFVVRPLIKELANEQDKTYRVKVIDLFRRIGNEVTMSLTEALKSKNDLMRQNASAALGLIKDDRALPYLKRIVENPNEKTEVKKYAVEAIEMISRKKVEELPGAKELFYALAEKYYYGHPSVMFPLYQTYFIWKWNTDTDELMERRPERFSLNEQVAEEACLNALEIDPNYDQAWSLLVNVLYAQEIEANLIIDAMDVEAKREMPNAKEKLEELKKKFENINRMNVLGNMASRKYLYLGLKRAIEDDSGYGNYPVAKSILDAIKEMGKPDELPPPGGSADARYIAYPLIQAFSYKVDKRIRYAAAEVMVRLNPQEMKMGMGTTTAGRDADLTMATLIEALGESGTRIALVIHDNNGLEDQNFLSRLKRVLARQDIVVEYAHTSLQGLTKARFFPNKDLVVMQSKFHNEMTFMETVTRRGTYETVMDAFINDARLKHTPLYFLSDTGEEDAAMRKVYEGAPVDDGRLQFVLKPIEEIKLQQLLDKTWAREEARKDSAAKAAQIARNSAEALASIDPTNTLFPYRDAIPPLIKKLSPEPVLAPDEVRIPCARALGRYGDVLALDILTKVLDDGGNKKDLRMTCLKAISNIYRLREVRPSDNALEVLKKLLVSGDYEFELASSEAIGNAKLSTKERVDLERYKQLKRWEAGQ